VAWWLFQNVAITSALAVLVVIVSRVTRIGPVARHALWVLVLVKFVTPPLIVWPWAAPDPFGLAALDVRVDGRSLAHPSGWHLVTEDGRIPAARVAAGPIESPALPPSEPRERAGTRVSAATLSWLLAIWAAGSLCLLTLEGVRLARLARRVKTAAPADPAIVTRVAELSARLGLRPLPVLTIAGSAAPVVWCLGRPRLLWPSGLSADAFRDSPGSTAGPGIDGVIVHELAHVKRRDHLVGWVELVAGVIWWWNPLFWYVRSALREQAELSCDAWVIATVPDGRRAYAESLLALSGAIVSGTRPRSMAAVVGISAGSRRALERRLVMVMKGSAPLRLPLAGLLALALMGAVTLPAWATGSQQPPPPPPPPQAAPAPKPSPQGQPPPPPPPAPAVKGTAPLPPPPPPKPAKSLYQFERKVAPSKNWTLSAQQAELPGDARQLLERYETDSQAIRKEIEKKLTERREALIKTLQDLQDQYTKAGKLDEAVAIRDFLKSGGPGNDEFFSWNTRAYWIRKQ
jgi:beta-lactamase regulating signal transducer with metallopeptidase domain